jgi:CheY-like chemotaxis protein
MTAKVEPKPPSGSTIQGFIRTGKAYVLVVDDDMSSAMTARELLLSNQYACDTVHSAGDALRAFQVRDYDLILVHLQASMREALRATKDIREQERHFPEPHVPMILFSASKDAALVAEATEAGIDEVVARPRDQDELLPIVERHVQFERRTSPGQIPREPVNFPGLLLFCGGDDARARKMVETFARDLADGISTIDASFVSQDVALLKIAAEKLRVSATTHGSGRIQRCAFLLARVKSTREMHLIAPEMIKELRAAATDFESWRLLQLGQAIPRQRPRIRPIRTSMVQLSSIFRKRLDIFSRSPAEGKNSSS